MPTETIEWGFVGQQGRVTIALAWTPCSRETRDRLGGEVCVELSGAVSVTGTCSAGFAIADLVRFHAELGNMLAGGTIQATLGSVGDDVGLTLDAIGGAVTLTGFVGAGSESSVSFNDLDIDLPSLLRTYFQLDGACKCEVRRRRQCDA